MKAQGTVDNYNSSSNFGFRSQIRTNDSDSDGNWNFPPAPKLQSRPKPVSVLADWGPASYPNSRLPSSFKDWLASRYALVIGQAAG
jgi:hypothetical protein